MTVVTIATSGDAVGSGWSFLGPCGSTSAFWGEKPVQCGGKLTAAADSASNLITAMQAVENNMNYFGSSGPESTSFPGHI